MEKDQAYGIGMWAWLLQRITGLLLVFYLFMHIWWVHFTGVDTPFDFILDTLFVQSKSRLLILLVLVVPHALNGFRVFTLDFGISERAQKFLFWALLLTGMLVIILAYYSRF